MSLSAEIFETLALLPDRTPAQRAADVRSASALRHGLDWSDDWGRELFTSEDVDAAVANELRILADELAPSAKRPRAILLARAEELER